MTAVRNLQLQHCQLNKLAAQILRLRRSAKRTLRELEDLAISYLKQVPVLKQFAQRPTVTYLVWAVLASPIVTILVPLLALGGEILHQDLPDISRRCILLGHHHHTGHVNSTSSRPKEHIPGLFLSMRCIGALWGPLFLHPDLGTLQGHIVAPWRGLWSTVSAADNLCLVPLADLEKSSQNVNH